MDNDKTFMQSFPFALPQSSGRTASELTTQLNSNSDFGKCLRQCLVRLLRNTALKGNPTKLRQAERILLYKLRKARNIRDFETAEAILQLAKLCKYLIGMAELPQLLKELANRGWYIPLNLSLEFCSELRVLNERNQTELETDLMEYFSVNLDSIFKRVIKRHPIRKDVLLDAYKAHCLELYSLSIPVLLAQVDGICSGSLFMRKKGKHLKAFLVETMSEQDDIVDLLTWAITEEKPINAPPPKRNVQNLNRHAVMHGESVDYGTKRNSLQAISLLAYVDSLFSWNREIKLT